MLLSKTFTEHLELTEATMSISRSRGNGDNGGDLCPAAVAVVLSQTLARILVIQPCLAPGAPVIL